MPEFVRLSGGILEPDREARRKMTSPRGSRSLVGASAKAASEDWLQLEQSPLWANLAFSAAQGAPTQLTKNLQSVGFPKESASFALFLIPHSSHCSSHSGNQHTALYRFLVASMEDVVTACEPQTGA